VLFEERDCDRPNPLAHLTRIFVNPAIKKALCREAGAHRDWLAKVRPWWYATMSQKHSLLQSA
jgi:murein endopeptidase